MRASMQATPSLTAISLIRRPVRDTNYCTWLGPNRLYSANRVIRDLGFKPDFSGADPVVLQRAALRGKLVEGYCYDLIRGRHVTVRSKHCGSLYRDVSERVNAFWKWMQMYRPQYVDHQSDVWSIEDRIVWRRDLRVLINGTLWLIDIKCTSKPEKDWPLQLGCGVSYDEDGCNHAAILQLKPGMNKLGFKLRAEWPGSTLRSWWRRTVDRWQSNYDFNKLKNELGFDSEAFGFETEVEE